MNRQDKPIRPATSRRDFLKASGAALAGSAVLSQIAARSYAGEDNTIKIALIGCGGRGTGAAANAMAPQGRQSSGPWPTSSPQSAPTQHRSCEDSSPSRSTCPRSGGLSAWTPIRRPSTRSIAGGVVLLTTPPGFRPIHLEYAVAKGMPRVHGEVVRRGCPGHPPRAEGGQGGREEEPEDRRRADEPPLQAAGRGGRSGFTTAPSAR